MKFPRLLAVTFVSLLGTALVHAEPTAVAKKKIVFIAGKPSHPAGQHEHRAGCLLLADQLNKSGLPLEPKW